jgi:hypothetical protein
MTARIECSHYHLTYMYFTIRPTLLKPSYCKQKHITKKTQHESVQTIDVALSGISWLVARRRLSFEDDSTNTQTLQSRSAYQSTAAPLFFPQQRSPRRDYLKSAPTYSHSFSLRLSFFDTHLFHCFIPPQTWMNRNLFRCCRRSCSPTRKRSRLPPAS